MIVVIPILFTAYSSNGSAQSNSSINKPAEADEWYKQALERARNIAKNIGQPAKSPTVPQSDVLCPKLTPNLFPPQEVTQGNSQPTKIGTLGMLSLQGLGTSP